MEDEYRALVKAAQLLGHARTAVGIEDGISLISPAWKMLNNAQRHILQQADTLLRGNDSCEQTTATRQHEADLKTEGMMAS